MRFHREKIVQQALNLLTPSTIGSALQTAPNYWQHPMGAPGSGGTAGSKPSGPELSG